MFSLEVADAFLRSLPRRRSIKVAAAVFALAAGVVVAGWATPGSSSVFAAGDPVVAAAGDIACDPASANFNGGSGSGGVCQQGATFALLEQLNPAAVLALGDTQYYCGGYQAYLKSYALSWGKLLGKTFPVPGNHEYLTAPGSDGIGTGCDGTNAGGAGYWKYFAGAAKMGTSGDGWYSFDVGTWHLIAINSNCPKTSTGGSGCSTSSPQGQWLAADLAAHKNQCIAAFWHIPLWSSGGRAASNTQSIVNQLYSAHADVILNGHDHIYERFAQQSNSGALDTTNGIREFIIGTGGANLTSVAAVAANSEIRDDSVFGVLKLTLHPRSYDWSFLTTSGSVRDTGSHACHNAATPPPPSTSTATETQPTTAPLPTTTTVRVTTAQTSTAVTSPRTISSQTSTAAATPSSTAAPAHATTPVPARFTIRVSIAKRVLVHHRVTLVVDVRNAGGSPTAAGKVRMDLPPWLRRAGRPVGPSCVATRAYVVCSLQELPAGGRARVRVLVRPLRAGRYVVHAYVTAGSTVTSTAAFRAFLPRRSVVR
jgi:hypothetical protein